MIGARLRSGLWAGLAAALLLVAAASLALGSVALSPAAIVAGLAGGLGSQGDAASVIIMQDIRLPRLLAALCVGGALGMAGAAMQAVLRNPLADPGVLGISAAATLGATATLYFGLAAILPLALPIGAMAGAAAATGLLALAAVRLRGIATLILIGVALSSFCGAVMALVLNFAPNPFSLSDLVNWTLGSVANRSLRDLAMTVPFMAIGALLLLSQRRALSLLALGEDAAIGLGLDFARLRLVLIAGTGLISGAAVALAGAIGFVGIVAPHLVRPWVGHDPGRTLLPSAAAGAVMLAAADLLVRLLPTANELRLGVVAALAGAPLFFLIAWSRGSVRHG